MNFVLLTFITIFIVVPQVSASFVAFIDDEGIVQNELMELFNDPKLVAPKYRLEDKMFHSQFLTDTVFVLSFILQQLMSPSTAFRIPESEKRTAQRLTAVLDAEVSSQ